MFIFVTSVNDKLDNFSEFFNFFCCCYEEFLTSQTLIFRGAPRSQKLVLYLLSSLLNSASDKNFKLLGLNYTMHCKTRLYFHCSNFKQLLFFNILQLMLQKCFDRCLKLSQFCNIMHYYLI